MRFQVISSYFLTIIVAFFTLLGTAAAANNPINAEIKIAGDKITSKVLAQNSEEVSVSPGIVLISSEIHDTRPDGDWIPVDGIGYAARLEKSEAISLTQKIKQKFMANQRIYTAVIGAVVSGGSLLLGAALSPDPVTLQKLAGIPMAMGLSLMVWANRDYFSVYFNYKGWTPRNFKNSVLLQKEYLKTGIRPQGLFDASLGEKLAKLYLLEAAFMGLIDIGGVPVTLDFFEHFLATSVPYTLMTTYDLIILEKRDKVISAAPSRSEEIKAAANLISIGIGFLDNVVMIVSQAGGPWGEAAIWVGAVAFNVYYFGKDSLKSQARSYSCPALF